MRKTLRDDLSVKPLGNLFEIQATGLRPPDDEELDAIASGRWLTGSSREVTVTFTLSVDDAMDLRDEINAWLRTLGVEGWMEAAPGPHPQEGGAGSSGRRGC